MSTILFPQAACKKIDKICRSFVWGSKPEKCKMHQVAWNEVIKPKTMGGLGIKDMRSLNFALIAKIDWRIVMYEKGLWIDILSKKYFKSAWGFLWRLRLFGKVLEVLFLKLWVPIFVGMLEMVARSISRMIIGFQMGH